MLFPYKSKKFNIGSGQVIIHLQWILELTVIASR